ncbi:MAG: head-tail connector protein [Rhodoferax sp.]|nr:head-tail connector protein [Rhodoferax sp.]MDP3650899.1 head-tail connector protein [Rhodoferax sp.]
MALKLITAATALAVSVVEAKLHLRVDGTDEDTLISDHITTATELAEQATGRAIMPQTWELALNAFPTLSLQITRVPAASVTTLKYVDSAGALQTLDSGLYILDNADDYGHAYVIPVYAGTWPATRDQVNAVALRYVAGYANAAAVPQSIKAWIKLMVGALYENRESETVGNGGAITLGFADRLLDRYKVYS